MYQSNEIFINWLIKLHLWNLHIIKEVYIKNAMINFPVIRHNDYNIKEY